MSKALDTQIGGGHYKAMKIQPIEYTNTHLLIISAFVRVMLSSILVDTNLKMVLKIYKKQNTI